MKSISEALILANIVNIAIINQIITNYSKNNL